MESWFDRVLRARATPWRVRRQVAMIVAGPLIHGRLAFSGAEIGSELRCFGMPIIRVYRGSTIRLGDHCILRSWRASNIIGLSHAVMITTMTPEAVIDIGPSVGISGGSISSARLIVIGARTIIGANVVITDSDHHRVGVDNHVTDPSHVNSAPVRIGSDVFIGMGSMILKGCTIGNGAVIGAGSVVIGNVPSGCLAAGNPARVVKELDGTRV